MLQLGGKICHIAFPHLILNVISYLNSVFPFIKILLRNTTKYRVNETCSLIILLQNNDRLDVFEEWPCNSVSDWKENSPTLSPQFSILALTILLHQNIPHSTLSITEHLLGHSCWCNVKDPWGPVGLYLPWNIRFYGLAAELAFGVMHDRCCLVFLLMGYRTFH